MEWGRIQETPVPLKPVQFAEKLNGDQLHEHCRSQQNDPYGREPVYPLELEGRWSELNRCELLADYLFASRARPRPLSEERTDGRALAHLFRQHRDGAMAADDYTRHAQCRTFRPNDPLCGGDVFQGWRSPLLLD